MANKKTEEKDIYGIFNEFLQKTVVEKKSFFSPDSEIFNKENLEVLINKYVKAPILGTTDGDKKLDFETKFKRQLEDANEENYSNARLVFGNLMWLQYLPAKKPYDKKDKKFGVNKAANISKLTGLDVSYTCDGRAKYGMAAMQLDSDLTDLILLFQKLLSLMDNPKKLKNSSNGDEEEKLTYIKKYIIRWCLDLNDENTFSRDNNGKSEGIRTTSYTGICGDKRECPNELLPIHNMLLHLCKPEYYDDISVSGHKKKITETFDALIPRNAAKDDKDDDFAKLPNDFYDDDKNYNKKYYIILNEIHKVKSKSNEDELLPLTDIEKADTKTRIYDYKDIWNAGKDTDFNDVNALRLKKAIILYGPPGTSKTYSATSLAQNLILKCNYNKELATFISENKGEKYIHKLQLHPNYTYEDFIWGYQIENTLFDKQGNIWQPSSQDFHCVGNRTIAKPGYFLRLLQEIENNKDKAYVLILDEINRVELSRLFGELFSAIENRGKAVDLPVLIEGCGGKVDKQGMEVSQVIIPDNLYIIGTMNEIDFSLESVDFALRRRFLWLPYGYDANALRDIIEDKVEKANIKKNSLPDIEWDDYCETCTKLNKAIRENPELGPKYEIGHTFFAEIVDIITETNLNSKKMLSTSKTILWNISIRPMLEAFFGKCTEETKNQYLKPEKTVRNVKGKWLDDIFLGKVEDK